MLRLSTNLDPRAWICDSPEPLQVGAGGFGKFIYAGPWGGYVAVPVMTNRQIDQFHRREIRRDHERTINYSPHP